VGDFLQFKFYKDCKENRRVEGKVLEMVPTKKRSYSWVNKSAPNFPKTIVTWTLKPAGKNTKLTSVHTGFDPESRWYDLHNQGWSLSSMALWPIAVKRKSDVHLTH
jgi:uncharacterized protein YndB with AHSA1/START domain